MLTQQEKYMCDATDEFYKCFGSLQIIFSMMFCWLFMVEKSFPFRNVFLSLLCCSKKAIEPNYKNYRPLSLTDTDNKIIAFIFANRLQKVVDRLIGKEQSVYIKGRYLGENSRIILDVFNHCMQNDSKDIFLFMDFEKAFNSVKGIFSSILYKKNSIWWFIYIVDETIVS